MTLNLAWLASAQTRWKLIIAILLGVAIGLGQTPWGLWPLALFGLGALFWLFKQTPHVKQAAWIGWGAGLGYFGLVLSWIVEPFLVDAATFGWMAPFALFGMAGGLALFWALSFGLARRLNRSLFFLIAVWCLAEILRSYILTGFPWGLLGYMWIDTPFAQAASLVGPHGLGFATLLAVGCVFAGRIFQMIALVVVVAAGIWGDRREAQFDGREAGPVIRLIQPNAEQHLKWDPAWIPVFFQRGLEMTAAPTQGEAPALVIWPETSVPALLNNADTVLSQIVTAAGTASVIVGAQRRGETGYHNSLAVLDGGGVTALYDKSHLVPFGEYVPFGAVLDRFGIRGLAAQGGFGFAPGNGAQLIDTPIGRALPLICYEGIFPNFGAGAGRADVLLQITNDAWFGDISGPYQHLTQMRFRAIEQALPAVRSANTGVSAFINPVGVITASLPLGEAGYLDYRLSTAGEATIYTQTGDGPLGLLLILLCGGLIGLHGRKPIDPMSLAR
ncbi:apolipoprotein N-acyltransferase [Cochlodiniinecator piscidefendens]|uniref:apolipoprotein N-acyltransferase n=1 Tax=Cochlodiniinecator piscidefendens TaxID=2715756 RepID=UPI001407DEB1|nr:apolipoprotein N-acyltransferase [Cochlodiniinecator piscidefendens]